MRQRPAVRAGLLAGAMAGSAILGSCAARGAGRPAISPVAEAIAVAQQAVAAGSFATADSVLASAGAGPTTADSAELLFWRALILADPANPVDSGATAAVGLIDRYLAAAPVARSYEAAVVRRLAVLRATPPEVRVDTVTTIDSNGVRSAVAREVALRDRAHEEELHRLRDSLARTTAELERIRRRLSPARP